MGTKAEPGDGPTGAESPRGGHAGVEPPGVDVLTEAAAVLLQDRPVVALNLGLADAAIRCGRRGLLLQLVTPATTRLTLPVEMLFGAQSTTWVVRSAHGPGYYDGLRGLPLRWDGHSFSPAEPVPSLEWYAVPHPSTTGTVLMEAAVVHPDPATAEVGRLAEYCTRALSGGPPTGWGVAEPATSPWDLAAVTALSRTLAPEPTRLVVVGGRREEPAVGVLTVRTLAAGPSPGARPALEEKVRLVVGSRADPDFHAGDDLPDLLGTLPVTTAMVAVRAGPADGTREPFRGPTIPIAMLFGADTVLQRGIAHALAAPAPQVRLLGTPDRPAVWARLAQTPQNSEGADLVEVCNRVLVHFGLAPVPPGPGAF